MFTAKSEPLRSSAGLSVTGKKEYSSLDSRDSCSTGVSDTGRRKDGSVYEEPEILYYQGPHVTCRMYSCTENMSPHS